MVYYNSKDEYIGECMYKNIVIVHGIGGLHREMYFEHLKGLCEDLGLDVYMPSMGGYRDGVTYDTWREKFDREILPYIGKDTILVAQSMGTQFVVKYFAEKKINVGVYISTAGPYNILDIKESMQEKGKLFEPVSTTFAPTDEEREIFRNLDFPKYSFYTDNDTFFEEDNLSNYAIAIGSTARLLPGKAHFNMEDMLDGLKELEDMIKSFVTQ